MQVTRVRRHDHGFTLTEVLVVCVILGIIAAVTAAFFAVQARTTTSTIKTGDQQSTMLDAIARVTRDVSYAQPGGITAATKSAATIQLVRGDKCVATDYAFADKKFTSTTRTYNTATCSDSLPSPSSTSTKTIVTGVTNAESRPVFVYYDKYDKVIPATTALSAESRQGIRRVQVELTAAGGNERKTDLNLKSSAALRASGSAPALPSGDVADTPSAPVCSVNQTPTGATTRTGTLTWSVAGGVAPERYIVTRADNSGANDSFTYTAGTTHTDPNLSNSRTYTYQVFALSAGGASAGSNLCILAPVAPPTPTINVVATCSPTGTNVAVRVTDPSATATRVRVWRAGAPNATAPVFPGGAWALISDKAVSDPTALTLTQTLARGSGSYGYVAEAVTATGAYPSLSVVGSTCPSDTFTATCVRASEETPPNTYTLVRKQLRIVSPSAGADGYEWGVTGSNTASGSMIAGVGSGNDLAVGFGGTRSYWIRAITGTQRSAPVTVPCVARPAPPQVVLAAVDASGRTGSGSDPTTDNRIRVKVNKVSGATAYKVFTRVRSLTAGNNWASSLDPNLWQAWTPWKAQTDLSNAVNTDPGDTTKLVTTYTNEFTGSALPWSSQVQVVVYAVNASPDTNDNSRTDQIRNVFNPYGCPIVNNESQGCPTAANNRPGWSDPYDPGIRELHPRAPQAAVYGYQWAGGADGINMNDNASDDWHSNARLDWLQSQARVTSTTVTRTGSNGWVNTYDAVPDSGRRFGAYGVSKYEKDLPFGVFFTYQFRASCASNPLCFPGNATSTSAVEADGSPWDLITAPGRIGWAGMEWVEADGAWKVSWSPAAGASAYRVVSSRTTGQYHGDSHVVGTAEAGCSTGTCSYKYPVPVHNGAAKAAAFAAPTFYVVPAVHDPRTGLLQIGPRSKVLENPVRVKATDGKWNGNVMNAGDGTAFSNQAVIDGWLAACIELNRPDASATQSTFNSWNEVINPVPNHTGTQVNPANPRVWNHSKNSGRGGWENKQGWVHWKNVEIDYASSVLQSYGDHYNGGAKLDTGETATGASAYWAMTMALRKVGEGFQDTQAKSAYDSRYNEAADRWDTFPTLHHLTRYNPRDRMLPWSISSASDWSQRSSKVAFDMSVNIWASPGKEGTQDGVTQIVNGKTMYGAKVDRQYVSVLMGNAYSSPWTPNAGNQADDSTTGGYTAAGQLPVSVVPVEPGLPVWLFITSPATPKADVLEHGPGTGRSIVWWADRDEGSAKQRYMLRGRSSVFTQRPPMVGSGTVVDS